VAPKEKRRKRELDGGFDAPGSRQWAAHVLRNVGPKIGVRTSDVTKMDVGTTTRMSIDVEHTGAADVPRRWFVKLPSLDWRVRAITALPGLFHNEVRFYREVIQDVPVETPRLLQGIKTWRLAQLVLGDVREDGARTGHTGEDIGADGARACVIELAKLHSKFWQHNDFRDRLAWMRNDARRREDRLSEWLAAPLMRRALKLASGACPELLVKGALEFSRSRRRFMQALHAGPRTLVHHDCHAGNLYWSDGRPGLLDWQLARAGEGIGDVAYLLATSLQPEDRRTHERELVELYGSELKASGVHGIESAQLWSRYQLHLVYPLEAMLMTRAMGGLMPVDINDTSISRAANAVAEHDSFKLLARAAER
jgi:hypothetical protein